MKKEQMKKFIKGPLDGEVVATLIREEPSSALHAYIVVLYACGLHNSKKTGLSYKQVKELGVNPRSFQRGLITLVARGIIKVQRGPGVKPYVEIL